MREDEMTQNFPDENKKLRELLKEATRTIERLRGYIPDDSSSAKELKKETDSFLAKVNKELTSSSGCLIAAVSIFIFIIIFIYVGQLI